ncbi:MAG: hypothetical protein QF735_01250, partial [Phycisphaeraceae bacterium]|nr:hypothetical protein [Phycisphaeraceae bacterium]
SVLSCNTTDWARPLFPCACEIDRDNRNVVIPAGAERPDFRVSWKFVLHGDAIVFMTPGHVAHLGACEATHTNRTASSLSIASPANRLDGRSIPDGQRSLSNKRPKTGWSAPSCC